LGDSRYSVLYGVRSTYQLASYEVEPGYGTWDLHSMVSRSEHGLQEGPPESDQQLGDFHSSPTSTRGKMNPIRVVFSLQFGWSIWRPSHLADRSARTAASEVGLTDLLLANPAKEEMASTPSSRCRKRASNKPAAFRRRSRGRQGRRSSVLQYSLTMRRSRSRLPFLVAGSGRMPLVQCAPLLRKENRLVGMAQHAPIERQGRSQPSWASHCPAVIQFVEFVKGGIRDVAVAILPACEPASWTNV
jgi:hypothetical protein